MQLWCGSPVVPSCCSSNHALVGVAVTASWHGSGIVASWCGSSIAAPWCGSGIMAWVWVHAVVSQHPSCSHVSSMRFHWPWAHTNCLPDLVILVSTLQTHSSLTSPQCAPSLRPDNSGAKKCNGYRDMYRSHAQICFCSWYALSPHLAVSTCKIVSVSV